MLLHSVLLLSNFGARELAARLLSVWPLFNNLQNRNGSNGIVKLSGRPVHCPLADAKDDPFVNHNN